MRKVAIVGIDGLSWEILWRYLTRLKTVKRVVLKSLNAFLECVPPLTPPSWTSIFTGVKPSKHGILSFVDLRTGKHVNSLSVPFPRISELLAMNGYRCLVINSPFSYPLRGWYLRNHVIIYDSFSPREFAYPSSVSKYLRFFKRIGRASTLYELLDKAARIAEDRVEGTLRIIQDFNPDFTLVVFNEVDNVMHRAYHVAAGRYDHFMERMFASIDVLVSELERTFDIVVMVSDHGHRLFLKCINIAYYLEYLSQLRRFGLTDKVKALILGNVVAGYVRYALKALRINRRINVKVAENESGECRVGKFYVDPHDVNDASFIAIKGANDKLLKLTYLIIKKEFGKYIDSMELVSSGDINYLVITPKEDTFPLLQGKFYSSIGKREFYIPSAQHSRFGMLSVSVKGVSLNGKFRLARNYDVLPTILALAQVPIPNYVDGEPLLKSGEVKYVSTYLQRWKLGRRSTSLRLGMLRS